MADFLNDLYGADPSVKTEAPEQRAPSAPITTAPIAEELYTTPDEPPTGPVHDEDSFLSALYRAPELDADQPAPAGQRQVTPASDPAPAADAEPTLDPEVQELRDYIEFPAGFEIDHVQLDDLAKTAHVLGVDAGLAQDVVDLAADASVMTPREIERLSSGWRAVSESRFSPGDLKAAAALAQRTLTPAQLEALDATGLGSHPKVIAAFVTAARRGRR